MAASATFRCFVNTSKRISSAPEARLAFIYCWHISELASGADEIRHQPLYFRPSYAQFLHNRPHYAVLAQPQVSLNAPVYRPRYAVFGGQFMP